MYSLVKTNHFRGDQQCWRFRVANMAVSAGCGRALTRPEGEKSKGKPQGGADSRHGGREGADAAATPPTFNRQGQRGRVLWPLCSVGERRKTRRRKAQKKKRRRRLPVLECSSFLINAVSQREHASSRRFVLRVPRITAEKETTSFSVSAALSLKVEGVRSPSPLRLDKTRQEH